MHSQKPNFWWHGQDFPRPVVDKSVAMEPITWQSPVDNTSLQKQAKSIAIIQGWLLVGGSELGFLEVLAYFAKRGYRVTMIFTRAKYPEGYALRGRVAEYTNDLHFLPSFLRLREFPGYIKYLIATRGITAVFMSNSQLIYEILPALVEQTPGVKWIDYVRDIFSCPIQ